MNRWAVGQRGLGVMAEADVFVHRRAAAPLAIALSFFSSSKLRALDLCSPGK